MGLFDKNIVISAAKKSVYWVTENWKTAICAKIVQSFHRSLVNAGAVR